MENIKTALDFKDAFEKFTRHNIDGFIQWKNTYVCMDFHCECGHSNHYDGAFAYVVKCGGCGNFYAPSSKVEMIRLETADEGSYLESELQLEK